MSDCECFYSDIGPNGATRIEKSSRKLGCAQFVDDEEDYQAIAMERIFLVIPNLGKNDDNGKLYQILIYSDRFSG